MSVQIDFGLFRFEDGVLSVEMVPAVSIAGWRLQYTQWKRFQNTSGSTSGIITKMAASGFGGGQSGITITNSGQGRFNVALFATDMSGSPGPDPGEYYYKVERMDSGFRQVLTEGYRQM